MPSTARPVSHRPGVLGIVLAALGLLAGCDPAAGSTADSKAAASTVASTESAAASTTSTAPATSEPPISTLPPEPTGVPGIDDVDEFCAAWARYSGSLQIVSIAVAFGGMSSEEIARFEAFAAPTVVDAVATIGAEWPAELDTERTTVLDDVLGPYQRRAERVLQALRDAGATDADLQALTAAWLDALRTRDNNSPSPTLPAVSPELAAIVDTAAAAFDAAVTPFADDPSLRTVDADTPLTDQLLARRCPDLASIGVGDAI